MNLKQGVLEVRFPSSYKSAGYNMPTIINSSIISSDTNTHQLCPNLQEKCVKSEHRHLSEFPAPESLFSPTVRTKYKKWERTKKVRRDVKVRSA